MNVKDFLLSVECDELKARFMERAKLSTTRDALAKNLETFLICMREIEPITTELVMLFCEGNEPEIKIFEYWDLEALYSECELLYLVPESLSREVLEKVCRKWSQMRSYSAERMPWQLVLGAEIDPENWTGHSAVEIAEKIIIQMAMCGYDEPDEVFAYKAKASWKNDETEFYIQVMPLKDGLGFVEEPEVLALRRFLRQKISMYKAIHDYMTRKERRTYDICTV